jgi:hypothetical protein
MSLYILNREEQKFFLNGNQVRGVQSVQASYAASRTPIRYLGMSGKGNLTNFTEGDQAGKLSVNSLLIADDQFVSLTGVSPFNAYVLIDKNNTSRNLTCISGYLNNYRIGCSLGQIPEISIDTTIYGDMGTLASTSIPDLTSISNSSEPSLKIAEPGSVSVTVSSPDATVTLDKILGFDLSLTVQRRPEAILGLRTPITVKTVYPIEVDYSFRVSAKNYDSYSLNTLLRSVAEFSISTVFSDLKTSTPFFTHSITNAAFIGESHDKPVDSPATVRLSFKAYFSP